MAGYYKDPLSIEDIPSQSSSSMKKKISTTAAGMVDRNNLRKTGGMIKTMGKGAVSGATFGMVNPGSPAERASLDYRLGSDLGGAAAPVGLIGKAPKAVSTAVKTLRGTSRAAKVASSEARLTALTEQVDKARKASPGYNPTKVPVPSEAELAAKESLATKRARANPPRGTKTLEKIDAGIDSVTTAAGNGTGDLARAKTSAQIASIGGTSVETARRITENRNSDISKSPEVTSSVTNALKKMGYSQSVAKVKIPPRSIPRAK